ncbi:hypothetical protein X980_6005 [Burkholderia pseudomallei MSHR4000]|nr:hypothetical protein X980_6005 [Burkholderia pseudomallei MSHR4000]
MMGTTLMPVLAVVYDGRREVLTDQLSPLIQHPARSAGVWGELSTRAVAAGRVADAVGYSRCGVT